MARKQAKRRKPKQKTKRFELPSIRFGAVATPLIAVLVVFASYHVSGSLLDRPIQSVEISGPFQRVTALQIEGAISEELDAGFLGADLGRMQSLLQELPWIDQATVARRWPSRIVIGVSEQSPAAVWGERGLMNIRGELFVATAERVPAELPRLSGPEGRSADVAKRYLEVREQLIPIGLNLRSVHLDARGSWEMTLQNGVDIRLGRRDVDERASLFIDVVADIISGRAAEIDYVDLRYSNGFTIGWKNRQDGPADETQSTDPEMLASRGAT